MGLNYSGFESLAFWVNGANVQFERLVPLRLKVLHHFIERVTARGARGVEDPGALGASKTPKVGLLNPYQLPVHGRLCRCAPILYDRMPGTACR
jgi:hypothetical protein